MKVRIKLSKNDFYLIIDSMDKAGVIELIFYELRGNEDLVLISENSYLKSINEEGNSDFAASLSETLCTLKIMDSVDLEIEDLENPVHGTERYQWTILMNSIAQKSLSGLNDISGTLDGELIREKVNKITWSSRMIIPGIKDENVREFSGLSGDIVVSVDLERGHFSSENHGCEGDHPDDIEIHDRTLLWLGKNNFSKIRGATLGCIGAGGLMNPFIIQAMHHGFEKFIIIDDDTLEENNLNRFLGASPCHAGLYKADILRETILGFNPGADVVVLKESFPFDGSENTMAQADLIVCGVDNDYTRMNVQLFALAMNKTLFDMGSAIFLEDNSSSDPVVDECGGQVRISIPGMGCLACMGMDLSRIRDFKRMDIERRMGYITGTGLSPASIITLNNTIAGICLKLVVDYICGRELSCRHLKYDERDLNLYKINVMKDENCSLCGSD